MLYGLGERIAEGRFVSPPIFWRSSPRGVDLLSFVTPNPLHPIMRWFTGDPLTLRPTHFVEYTASLSLVALLVIAFAVWRAGYRPRKRWFVLTLGFALLALGPFIYIAGINTHVPGPWALLRYVPGFGLARMPSRFAIVALLGVAVLMAGALAAIGERWPQRRRLDRRHRRAVAGVRIVAGAADAVLGGGLAHLRSHRGGSAAGARADAAVRRARRRVGSRQLPAALAVQPDAARQGA